MAPTVGADPRIGTELAGYRIDALLGRGGMSVVYLAEDLALGRKVALKLMSPELPQDRSFRERFRREWRLAASIDHPNVIPIYDAGEADGLLYIAMRYVEGTDLKSLLAREAPLDPDRTLALLSQVAAALDAAHARGLVHRDVKPSNILLAGSEGKEHVYLADFGLTKTATEGEESEGVQIAGTADYIAPEQVTGGTSEPSSDRYSLACVLYQCLTGRVPFPRPNEFAVLWAHVDEPPPRAADVRPELSRAVDDVIARALSKEPAARYETAGELIEATRLAFPKRTGGRRRLLVGAAILLTLAVAGAILAVARRDDESTTRPTLALASGALQRIDPDSNELVATVRVGGEPVDVAAGAGAVWLVDAARNTLVRVDPRTAEVTTQGPGTGLLAAVGTHRAFRSYVGSAADGAQGTVLARIAARDASTVETATIGNRPGVGYPDSPSVTTPHVSAVAAIAATDEAGWVADASARLVSRVGRVPPAPRVSIATDGMPIDLVTASRHEVWVAERDESSNGPRGRLLRVHETGEITARVQLAFAPAAIASGAGRLWIVDGQGARVWRIDGDRSRRASTSLGGRPIDVAVSAGSVWVLLSGVGTLVRLDPETLRIIARTRVGPNPTALAVGEDDLWVAAQGGVPLSLLDFPTRLRRGFYEIAGMYTERSGERCDPAGPPIRACVILGSARVTTSTGTSGSIRVAVKERRRRGGSVSCLGKRYQGPLISDVSGDAGTGRLEIRGWGTIALHLERHVLVTSTVPDARALCLAQSGTWVGLRGPIRGEGGTFTTRGPGRVLVFDS